MMFPSMREIIPEGESGEYRIEHFEITPKEAEREEMRSIYNRNYLGRMTRPGKFCRLIRGEGWSRDVLMSDTHAERNTNREVVKASHGHVLIAGLGLGMVICPIAQKEEVETVTVVEISKEVIGLIQPHLCKYLGDDAKKIKIFCEDIFKFVPTHKFDVIYFDIWCNISGDEYEDTKKLHRKFSRKLVRDGDHFMESWMRWLIKDLHFGRW